MADFEEAHAPGGPPVEATVSRARKAGAERTPMAPPPKKTGTAAPAAVEQVWYPAIAGPTVVGTSHAESQKHGTFGAVATCMCDHPSIGKFLRGCITILCIVALVCSGAHPGRHWPTCFDQTCGYPGEGPLTTLDSPDARLRRVTWSGAKRKRSEVGTSCVERVTPPSLSPPSNPDRMVSSAGNVMCGQRSMWKGCCGLYIVVVCQTLLRMSAKAKAASRGSAAGQPKEHLDRCKARSSRWTSTSAWSTGLPS